MRREDDYFQQYYSDKPTFAQANPVDVAAPSITTGVDARLVSRHAPPRSPGQSAAPIPVPPISLKPSPKPKLHCGKGKRLVKAKGKSRCVKKLRRGKHRPHTRR